MAADDRSSDALPAVIRTARPWAPRHPGAARLIAVALIGGSIVSGCLSLDEPSPSVVPSVASPSAAAPSIAPSQPPHDEAALTIAVPTFPGQLLPPAADASAELLLSLLYDPLYRLDGSLVPQPQLAGDLPQVSEDGLTWTIRLADGDLRFADGSPLTAADVETSLRIARSPTCSLGREMCATALEILDSVEAVGEREVRLTLNRPYAPLLTEVLAEAPILEEAALRDGAAEMVRAAAAIRSDAPDKLVTLVYRAVGDEACLVEQPPVGCALSDHIPELEAMLTNAGLPLPAPDAFTSDTGQLDAAAYANELLDRVASLGQVLSRSGIDRLAAALPLLDLSGRSVGSGPYRLAAIDPGVSVRLEAVERVVPPAATIPRITLQVVADPAAATTQLIGGDVDWVLQTDAQQVAAIEAASGMQVGSRPLPAQWTIVFNTRSGRLYSDARVRQAFDACVDRDGLTAELGGLEAVAATTPIAPGSWAMSPDNGTPRDIVEADRLLDAAGWVMAGDGIRVRDGVRLSSSIAVRASQTSMVALAQGMAGQLRDCGIELLVDDLDVTGDSLFQQLRWPNEFETLFTMRSLNADPDADLEAFESTHASSAEQEIDANPGGYRSAVADQLIHQARESTDHAVRADLYGRLQDVLTRDVPAWPVWFDTGWAAMSDRVHGPAGPIDLRQPRYAWDIASWRLDEVGPRPSD
jgi:ABC-type transport system substrate-binding protein